MSDDTFSFFLVERAGLFVPCERWKTEHGDVRTSPWGVGFHSRSEAYAAIDANSRGADFFGLVNLPDADYYGLIKEMGGA